MIGGSKSRLNRENSQGRIDGLLRRGRRCGQGFTIIEVLIVLAVSGAMLISALALIHGKQQVTAFNQSSRSVQTQLQQIINEVGSGYYPNNNSITCSATGPGGSLKLTSVPKDQGTNQDCIFIGKVVQFAVGPAPTDPQLFNVYALAGRTGSAASASTDLQAAKARLIARGTAAGDVAGMPDTTETKRLQYGLTVSKMYYNGDESKTIGAVGFTSSLGSLGAADASTQVDVVAVPNTTLHKNQAEGVQQINNAMTTLDAADVGKLINPPGGVQICFDSGGTDSSGLISIGGAGRQGTVELKIFNGPGCS